MKKYLKDFRAKVLYIPGTPGSEHINAHLAVVSYLRDNLKENPVLVNDYDFMDLLFKYLMSIDLETIQLEGAGSIDDSTCIMARNNLWNASPSISELVVDTIKAKWGILDSDRHEEYLVTGDLLSVSMEKILKTSKVSHSAIRNNSYLVVDMVQRGIDYIMAMLSFLTVILILSGATQ